MSYDNEQNILNDVYNADKNALRVSIGFPVDNIQFNTEASSECVEGNLGWDADAGTLQLGMPGGNVCLQLGEEQLIRVTNKSGGLIENGTPVYVSGAEGTNIWIDVADASIPDNNRKTLAVATEDIIDNQKGFVTTFGFVRDIDTDTITEGNEIFVAVGGGFTNVKPALPNGIVRVGYVTRESAEVGEIFVTIADKSVKDILTDSGDLTIKTEAEKTAVLEQSVYKDINFGSAQLTLPASSAPGLDEFKDNTGADTGIATRAFNTGEKVSAQFELQHDWKEGTALSPHLHYQIIGAPTGTDRIKWQLIYTISRNGTTLSPTTTITVETEVSTQYSFYISSFPDIIGTGFKIGDQFLFQLSRITASADEFAGDALLSTAGVHYEIDTMGSRQKFIK